MIYKETMWARLHQADSRSPDSLVGPLDRVRTAIPKRPQRRDLGLTRTAGIEPMILVLESTAESKRANLYVVSLEFRGFLVYACYWCMGMKSKIPVSSKVDLIGKYKPNRIGFGGHKKGLKPEDHKL